MSIAWYCANQRAPHSCFLGNMVHDILAEYGKSLTDVFSSTTDTANSAMATSNVLDWIVDNNIKVINHENDGNDESVFDPGPDYDVSRIVNQLSDCDEFGYKFDVDEEFWRQLEEIVSTLQPVYQLTIDMRKVDYGLADMYIGWLRAKKSLTRMQGNAHFDLAAKLIQKMDQRAPSLFKTPLMRCVFGFPNNACIE